ncbi:SDR family NAD(P)-dependent oxidoreductase [Candidatus Marimicrobium litorale]|uniref:SDR family NAD(P)-dependent oxidoreductase n=1 Tax=Candidatus Marimicrobium litorale TaxID=2518991 RepID=A0ABT3T9B2_9GAMM|nr:SDR family NAD(P)-dependent oxidoreductase [Candidatus Marimicrobium litorale]MCX2978634.1 SDR family NAD(P)-dependent oxidoreductase [Candidatus Marimicrobium litorale]
MKNFANKAAVVTGGASGIGLSLARRALAEGMKVVMVDIEQAALADAVTNLNGGENILGKCVDVRDGGAMQTLADEVEQRFGPTALLFNNAGVGGGGLAWEASEEDWDWVLGVNLRGVVNGLRAFVPQMIASGEGHIVNTASIAGLVSAPGTCTYTVSKHAVVALSEVLSGDLRNQGADVGVSVLCPSFVATRIYASDRNRGNELTMEESAEQAAVEEMVAEFFKGATSPDTVADLVFQSVMNDQFYILPQPLGSVPLIEQRMNGIVENTPPLMKGPEEYPAQ